MLLCTCSAPDFQVCVACDLLCTGWILTGLDVHHELHSFLAMEQVPGQCALVGYAPMDSRCFVTLTRTGFEGYLAQHACSAQTFQTDCAKDPGRTWPLLHNLMALAVGGKHRWNEMLFHDVHHAPPPAVDVRQPGIPVKT